MHNMSILEADGLRQQRNTSGPTPVSKAQDYNVHIKQRLLYAQAQ